MPFTTFAAAIIFLATPVVGGMTPASTTPITIQHSAISQDAVLKSSQSVTLLGKKSVLSQAQLAMKAEIETYYADTPILAEIAFCESSYRQLDRNGNVIRGIVDNDDVGVMQINLRYHGVAAEKLGFDLHTVEGNVAYAKYLYARQGTKPWKASEPCWGSSIN